MLPMAVFRNSKRGMILKTNQTTQYGGYLDDGYYQTGASKSLVALTTGQYSGSTNIVLNGKTDVHSNACVWDAVNRLLWSRTLAASVGPTSNGLLSWTTNANGEGIYSYAAAANAASLAGYNSGWRNPDINELQSIMDYEAKKADGIAFVPNITLYPWSSTSVNGTANALYFYFAGCYSYPQAKTLTASCLLVRSL